MRIFIYDLRSRRLACSQSSTSSSPEDTRRSVSLRATSCNAGESPPSPAWLRSTHCDSINRSISSRGNCIANSSTLMKRALRPILPKIKPHSTAARPPSKPSFSWSIKVMAHPLAGANVDRGVRVEIRRKHRKNRGWWVLSCTPCSLNSILCDSRSLNAGNCVEPLSL